MDFIRNVFQSLKKVDGATELGKGSDAKSPELIASVDDCNGSHNRAENEFNMFLEVIDL